VKQPDAESEPGPRGGSRVLRSDVTIPFANPTDSAHPQDDRRAWLIAVAAPRELDAAINGLGYTGDRPTLWQRIEISSRIDLVMTGVSKANAAGAIGRVLDPARHRGVLSIGIAGALPGSDCALGDVVVGSASVFADEGVQTPDGFETCAQMGFGLFDSQADSGMDSKSDSIAHDSSVVEWLGRYCDHIGPIACVSQCSGTDAGAQKVVARTGAIAEAMEGAAIALAAKRIEPTILVGEVRVISNTTGDRAKQRWALDDALGTLGKVLGRIADDLR